MKENYCEPTGLSLLDFPRYVRNGMKFMHERGHFMVEGSNEGKELKKIVLRELFAHYLGSLLASAKDVRVYPMVKEDETLLEQSCFVASGRQYRFEGSEDELLDVYWTMGRLHRNRFALTFLFCCENDEVDWPEFFKKSFDPKFLENPSVAVPKAALRYTKEHKKENFVNVTVFGNTTLYPNFLFSAEPSILRRVFDETANHSQITKAFYNCYRNWMTEPEPVSDGNAVKPPGVEREP